MIKIVEEFQTTDGIGAMLWKKIYAMSYAYQHKMLFKDKEDLIHKACGWMLREAGKKDIQRLEEFLTKNIKFLSRTTLRYAIEKMNSTKRKKYLSL